jgi:AmmeMemoRadiSam system protein B
MYSGPTVAWAYKYLEQQFNNISAPKCSRIFLFGHSHHVYIKGCALSGAKELETPLGNLKVDTDCKTSIM